MTEQATKWRCYDGVTCAYPSSGECPLGGCLREPIVVTGRAIAEFNITLELAAINFKALHVIYGGRRRFRHARQAAQRAALGPGVAPIKKNRRKGWRRA